MGLDWHSAVPATREYREDYVRRYYASELQGAESQAELLGEVERGPHDKTMDELIEAHVGDWMKPCSVVGAPKMGDRPTFEADMQELLDFRKKDSARHANSKYAEYWADMTLEKLMDGERDKWDCKNCPLLLALQGADSSDSFFLGLTVSSCYFRGKCIGRDDGISEDLAEEAYEEHDPDAMLDYAARLEVELEACRQAGLLKKDTYEEYVAMYESDPWCRTGLGGPKLSEQEYEQQLHWREQNLRKAIHWLRTCSTFGVYMRTSY